MVRISTCIGCQYGHHCDHVRVIQGVPEGVIGGVVCGCKGECEGNPDPHIQKQFKSIAEALRGRGRRDGNL